MSMELLKQNLLVIKNSTEDIKLAIIDKGGEITGGITTWANSINNIKTGGTKFRITNKWMESDTVKILGNPSLHYQYKDGIITGSSISQYQYTFEGGVPTKSLFIIPPSYVDWGNGSSNNLASFNGTLQYGSVDTYIGNFFSSGTLVSIDNPNNPWTFGYSYLSGNASTATSNIPVGRNNNDMSINTDGLMEIIPVLVTPSRTCWPSANPIWVYFETADGLFDYDIVYFERAGVMCYLKGTQISLADGTYKNVEDITYNDMLKVWNFDDGKYDEAAPFWIKKAEKSDFYYHCVLENGLTIDLVGPKGICHRLFSITKGRFEYPTLCIGDEVFTEQGITKIVSCEEIQGECEYYNIITNYHINCFANQILTSCRLNNLYPIENMKFIKHNDNYTTYKEYLNILKNFPGEVYINLRLRESPFSIEENIKYIQNLMGLKKEIWDFEGNEIAINDPENTEVGYIDKEGNVYGFRQYMLGLGNHEKVANFICNKLGIEIPTIGGAQYVLEKMGYMRFSPKYFLSPDDTINDKQHRMLKKFMKGKGIKSLRRDHIQGENFEIDKIEPNKKWKRDNYRL